GHVVATGAMPDLDREYGRHRRFTLRSKLSGETLVEKMRLRAPNSKVTLLPQEGRGVSTVHWEIPVGEPLDECALVEIQRDSALELLEFAGHPYSLEEIFLLA